MRKITGTVTCSESGRNINKDAVIAIQLADCSLADAPSKKLASTQLKGITEFPFNFELEFDDTPIKNMNFGGSFAISIGITTNKNLDYLTDTRFDINDPNTKSIKSHLDLFVIPV